MASIIVEPCSSNNDHSINTDDTSHHYLLPVSSSDNIGNDGGAGYTSSNLYYGIIDGKCAYSEPFQPLMSSPEMGSSSQLIEKSTAALTALVQSSSTYYWPSLYHGIAPYQQHNHHDLTNTTDNASVNLDNNNSLSYSTSLYQQPTQHHQQQPEHCYYCYRELSCPAGFVTSDCQESPVNNNPTMSASSYSSGIPTRMVMSVSSPRDFSANSSMYQPMSASLAAEEEANLMGRSISGGAISAMTSRRLLPPLPFEADKNHGNNSSPVNLSRNHSLRDSGNQFQRNAPVRVSAGAQRMAQRANRLPYTNGANNYINIPNSASGPELQQAIQHSQSSRGQVLDSPCASEPAPGSAQSSPVEKFHGGMKARLAELESERNRLQNELNSLSHHCSWAIRNRNDSYIEVERLKNEIQLVRMKAHSEMQTVVERLAAKEHEYALVMSERDTVLRELEDLQDRLTEAEKKVKTLGSEKETLRSALDATSSNELMEKEMNTDYEEKLVSLEQILSEKCDELESTRLRCEWALCERERISEERDRLRLLTEQLMRERDDSNQRVSELTSQLEEITAYNKQHQTAANRSGVVQRTVTSSSSTSSSMINNGVCRNNRSRDSAIDSDAEHLAMARENQMVLSSSDSDETGQKLPLPIEWPPNQQQQKAQITQSTTFPPSTPRSLRRPHLAGGIDDFALKHMSMVCEAFPLIGVDQQSDQSIFVESCAGLKIEAFESNKRETKMSFGPAVIEIEPNSPAHLAGIEVGDRLVEIAGINVRGETRQNALHILCQQGPHISISIARPRSPNSASFSISPAVNRKPGRSNSITSKTGPPVSKPPRYVYITRPESALTNETPDIELIGGNVAGIFVGSLSPDNQASLQVGDQILEINGVSLRGATLENAYVELNRPGEELVVLAQSNSSKYETTLKRTRTGGGSGDGFYVRCLVDWQAAGVIVSPDASDAPFYLPLQKDSVLYVDNTMPDRSHRNVGGFWSAWVLDSCGQPIRRGLIPSKLRFEDEPSLLAQKSSNSLNNIAAQSTARSSTRRISNFIRRARLSSSAILGKLPRHQSGSNEHHHEPHIHSPNPNVMIASACSWAPESVYQRVEPLDRSMLRPVLILSPIADTIIYRLVTNHPNKFEALQTDIIRSNTLDDYSSAGNSSSLSYFVASDISRSLHLGDDGTNSELIRVRDNSNPAQMESFSISKLSFAAANNRHCLMDVSPAAIERLMTRRVYPIVIFIRHSSASQLKRIKGAEDFLVPRKMTRSTAIDMFEQFNALENEYQRLISATLSVDSKRDNSVESISAQVGALIEIEQQKQQWVPSHEPL